MKKLLLLPLLALCLLACRKEQTPTTPVITEFGITAADTTIAVGRTIELKPQLNTTEKVAYIWQVDNISVAYGATYTFDGATAGRYSLTYIALGPGGQTSHTVIINVQAFTGGMFIVNEGWFGHESGSVNYFDPATQEITTNVYQSANEAKTLGTTTCYGARWMDNFYFISKQGRRLVVADAMSMADRGSIDMLSGGDGRAFVGISETDGVVTTSEGAYVVKLSPLSIAATPIAETEGSQCGGVFATKDHLFVINQDEGLQIFAVADNYKLVASEADVSVGFALAKDGSLWAADGSTLFGIDPKTLAVTRVAMPASIKISNSWGSWNKGSLCASPLENVIYFAKSGAWGGGREIYRYRIGDPTSLDAVFASSTKNDDAFYGGALAVDPVTGDIVATFVRDGWGDSYNDNRLVTFDGKTGIEKSRITFEHYWFPAMVLFN